MNFVPTLYMLNIYTKPLDYDEAYWLNIYRTSVETIDFLNLTA